MKQRAAITSSTCHTRWLWKVDVEIGRQTKRIPPVPDHGPGAALRNLIGLSKSDIPRSRQGHPSCMIAWTRTAVIASFQVIQSWLPRMHERWRDRQSFSGFMFPMSHRISSVTVVMQVPFTEGR